MTKEAALVVGAGPGLGSAIARRLVKSGRKVAESSRKNPTFPCDATDPSQVKQLVARVEDELGPLDVVVFNAGSFGMASILDLEPADFEAMWRSNAYAGFLVGREAARVMTPRGRGTILFTGATASLRGAARFAAFAAAKSALRAVAQSMARELGPKGIHVAHVVIDGTIGTGEGQLAPDAIAETYQHLVDQPRSAWTHELDLRPHGEKF